MLPTLDEIKASLRRLIEENAGIPAEVVADDATVDGDLAMDSMSLISLQVAVEETFGITFSADDLAACASFAAIAALVAERVREAADATSTSRRSAARRVPRQRTDAGGKVRRLRAAPRTRFTT